MIFRPVPWINGVEEPPRRRLEEGDRRADPPRQRQRGEPVEEQVAASRR